MRFYCSCFDDCPDEAGFDTEAVPTGVVSVKIGSDGKLLYVNDEGYDGVGVGTIDYSMVRCGSCGDLISPSDGTDE